MFAVIAQHADGCAHVDEISTFVEARRLAQRRQHSREYVRVSILEATDLPDERAPDNPFHPTSSAHHAQT